MGDLTCWMCESDAPGRWPHQRGTRITTSLHCELERCESVRYLKRVTSACTASLLAITAAIFCTYPWPLAADEALANEGAVLVQETCTQCHGLRPVQSVRNGRPGWEQTVHKMVVYGAQLNIEEVDTVIDYLVTQYGPGSATPMATGPLPPGAAGEHGGSDDNGQILLPAGEGQALVQAYCSLCHDTGRIAATRRTSTSWQQYTNDMLAKGGIVVSPDQVQQMVEFLGAHFGREH